MMVDFLQLAILIMKFKTTKINVKSFEIFSLLFMNGQKCQLIFWAVRIGLSAMLLLLKTPQLEA